MNKTFSIELLHKLSCRLGWGQRGVRVAQNPTEQTLVLGFAALNPTYGAIYSNSIWDVNAGIWARHRQDACATSFTSEMETLY